MRSKKPRAVALVKWLTRKGIEKIQEDKQLLGETIEWQDSAMALLNDDLVERDMEIQQLHDENIALQRRAVPYLKDQKKDNWMEIIHKNNGYEFPYMAICGQQGYVAQKIKNKFVDYPNRHIMVLAESPNANVHYNCLRERRCIVANQERVRHFRLGDNYTHQKLMELQEA